MSIADEEEAYRAVTELYRCGHRRIAALVARTDDRHQPAALSGVSPGAGGLRPADGGGAGDPRRIL